MDWDLIPGTWNRRFLTQDPGFETRDSDPGPRTWNPGL